MGLDYEAEKAKIVDPHRSPMPACRTRSGTPATAFKTYRRPRQFLKAVAEFQATGAKLNATYVYDHATGLKLFGKTAFYVRSPTASS